MGREGKNIGKKERRKMCGNLIVSIGSYYA
jgi:hypothetical protein